MATSDVKSSFNVSRKACWGVGDGLVTYMQVMLHMNLIISSILKNNQLKGTVSRDFLLPVFFMNHLLSSPRKKHSGLIEFFRKFAEIFGSPKVHHRHQRRLRQIMGTISGCGHLKVNLKAKIHMYVNSTIYPKVSKQNNLNFSD
jgi:hypothetical protein